MPNRQTLRAAKVAPQGRSKDMETTEQVAELLSLDRCFDCPFVSISCTITSFMVHDQNGVGKSENGCQSVTTEVNLFHVEPWLLAFWKAWQRQKEYSTFGTLGCMGVDA